MQNGTLPAREDRGLGRLPASVTSHVHSPKWLGTAGVQIARSLPWSDHPAIFLTDYTLFLIPEKQTNPTNATMQATTSAPCDSESKNKLPADAGRLA